VMKILEGCLEQSSVKIKGEDPRFAYRSYWQGSSLMRDQLPESTICRDLLWEVNELNFRQELLLLDSHFHIRSSTADLEDRRRMLDACWIGSADTVARRHLDGNQGLAAEKWEDRVPFLRALHKVMSTWEGRPARLRESFPDSPLNTFNVVMHIERTLANFYTTCFFEKFGRAASIP
ncbi:hypothetical protein BDP27DRAFT_1192788, partial [Rhodocollybia butyracea]